MNYSYCDRIDSLPEPYLATAPGYYDAMLNRIIVNFKPKFLESRHKGDFQLVLCKKMTYDTVSIIGNIYNLIGNCKNCCLC